MAWVEKSGAQTWRVRYRREDGTIGAINGFTDQDRRRPTRRRHGVRTTPGHLHRPRRREDHPAGLVTRLAGRHRRRRAHRGLLPQPAAPPHPAPLGRSRLGRHLRDQSRGLGETAARQGLLAAHRRRDHEAAVVAAGRRRRGTAHPGQPHPRPPTRPPPRRTRPRTGLGHPRRGPRGRRQRRPAARRRTRRGHPDRHRRLDRGPLGRARPGCSAPTSTSTPAPEPVSRPGSS